MVLPSLLHSPQCFAEMCTSAYLTRRLDVTTCTETAAHCVVASYPGEQYSDVSASWPRLKRSPKYEDSREQARTCDAKTVTASCSNAFVPLVVQSAASYLTLGFILAELWVHNLPMAGHILSLPETSEATFVSTATIKMPVRSMEWTHLITSKKKVYLKKLLSL